MSLNLDCFIPFQKFIQLFNEQWKTEESYLTSFPDTYVSMNEKLHLRYHSLQAHIQKHNIVQFQLHIMHNQPNNTIASMTKLFYQQIEQNEPDLQR